MNFKSSSPWQAAVEPADLIELGRLGGPWGVKGWTKIVPYSQDADVLMDTKQWFLKPPPRPFSAKFDAFDGTALVNVLQCKPHGDGLVALFEGADDRELMVQAKGASIWVSRQHFAPLPEGEYYWVDLLGLHVRNRQGLDLGVVTDLMSTGPHSVLVLEDATTGESVERLIPFVPVYIDEVQLGQGVILVDWQPDY